MESDWPHLPTELLTMIAEKAATTPSPSPSELVDYVRIRAVCKPWRRALTPQPRHLPHQAPWLLFSRNRDADCRICIDDSHLSFYDLSSSTTHQFELPFIRGKYICGSSYGWLLLEHYDHQVSLLNPITRSTIDLSSFLNPITRSSSDLPQPFYVNWDEPEQYKACIRKAILSCSPLEPGCCVVARFLSTKCELGFCRIGDAHWIELKKPNRELSAPHMLDFTCQNQLVYTVYNNNEVTIYDLENLSARTFAHNLNYHPSRDRLYLVAGDEESGGPLIVREFNLCGKLITSVYKWFNDVQPKWCQVENIGNRVLFLNHYYRYHTLSSANLQLEKWKGNQICYEVWKSYHIGINVVNLESGTDVEEFVSCVFPMSSRATFWFTPSLI